MLFISLFILGCGGGDSSSTPPSPPISGNDEDSQLILKGIVYDGSINDVTICLDTNADQNCTDEFYVTKSDENGSFTLSIPKDALGQENVFIAEAGVYSSIEVPANIHFIHKIYIDDVTDANDINRIAYFSPLKNLENEFGSAIFGAGVINDDGFRIYLHSDSRECLYQSLDSNSSCLELNRKIAFYYLLRTNTNEEFSGDLSTGPGVSKLYDITKDYSNEVYPLVMHRLYNFRDKIGSSKEFLSFIINDEKTLKYTAPVIKSGTFTNGLTQNLLTIKWDKNINIKKYYINIYNAQDTLLESYEATRNYFEITPTYRMLLEKDIQIYIIGETDNMISHEGYLKFNDSVLMSTYYTPKVANIASSSTEESISICFEPISHRDNSFFEYELKVRDTSASYRPLFELKLEAMQREANKYCFPSYDVVSTQVLDFIITTKIDAENLANYTQEYVKTGVTPSFKVYTKPLSTVPNTAIVLKGNKYPNAGVSLNWNFQKGVDYYELERSFDKEFNDFEVILILFTNQIKFHIPDQDLQEDYYYRVRSIKNISTTEKTYSEYSNSININNPTRNLIPISHHFNDYNDGEEIVQLVFFDDLLEYDKSITYITGSVNNAPVTSVYASQYPIYSWDGEKSTIQLTSMLHTSAYVQPSVKLLSGKVFRLNADGWSYGLYLDAEYKFSFFKAGVSNTDSDGDGLIDARDNCKYSKDLNVLEDGCSVFDKADSDADGVLNWEDICPYSKYVNVSEVEADGCVTYEHTDKDHDGVLDADDLCPLDYPIAIALTDLSATEGCFPIQYNDFDNDGVMDYYDICRYSPSGESVNEDGCSYDEVNDDDNDTIININDECKTTPSGLFVQSNGCTGGEFIDSDSDGVMNISDQCHFTKEGESVDANGCSYDQLHDDDNDGLLNVNDKCPNSTSTDVNDVGCVVYSAAGSNPITNLQCERSYPYDSSIHITWEHASNSYSGYELVYFPSITGGYMIPSLVRQRTYLNSEYKTTIMLKMYSEVDGERTYSQYPVNCVVPAIPSTPDNTEDTSQPSDVSETDVAGVDFVENEGYVFVAQNKLKADKYDGGNGWWFAHGTLQDTFTYYDTEAKAKRIVSNICESPRKVVQSIYHSASTGLDYVGKFYYCGKPLEGGNNRNIKNLKTYSF